VGPLHLDAISHRLKPEQDKTPPKKLGRAVGPAIQGPRRLTALNSQLGIAFLAETTGCAAAMRRIFEPASRRCASCCRTRRDRRQSRRLCDVVAAGASRHRALQLQLRCRALKGKDVPVELAIPDTGPVGWTPACMWSPMRPSLSSRCIYRHASRSVVQRRCSQRLRCDPDHSK